MGKNQKPRKTSQSTDLIVISDDVIKNRILYIRGLKVLLDKDLADLYGVETKVLNQAVRRNIDRFPLDFRFELTQEENDCLRSQIVTLNKRGAHSKYLPSVFTEQGVAMLSSVLRSPQAIQVNIQIMRIYTRIRQMITDNTELRLEVAEIKQSVEQISKKLNNNDKNVTLIFEYIDRLQEKIESPTPPDRTQIGYEVGLKKKADEE